MSDDYDLPTNPKKHTPGSLYTMLNGLLAARGVIVTPQDRVKFAVVQEALSRDVAISPDGNHFVVLRQGHPVHAPPQQALEQLANVLAVQLGGTETAVPKSVEEVAALQRKSLDYG